MEQVGLGRHPPGSKTKHRWDYASLAEPPAIPEERPWASSIYRGLIPAKNILNRDFAVNGAMVLYFLESGIILVPLLTIAPSHEQFSAHHAYVTEVSAHWIAAYFRRDALWLPQSVGEALDATEKDSEWIRRRYPHTLNAVCESITSAVAFWR